MSAARVLAIGCVAYACSGLGAPAAAQPAAAAGDPLADARVVATPETADFVAALLRAQAAADGCELTRLTSSADALDATLRAANGRDAVLRLVLETHTGSGILDARLRATSDASLAATCPLLAQRLAAVLAEARPPFAASRDTTQQDGPRLHANLVGVATAPGAAGAPLTGPAAAAAPTAAAPWLTAAESAARRWLDALPRGGPSAASHALRFTQAALLAWLAAAALALGRAMRAPHWQPSGAVAPALPSRRVVAAGVVTLVAAAAALRLAVPWGMVNWYADVLPPHGWPPQMRFGPGLFVFHAAVRTVAPWTPTAWLTAHIAVGAATAGLWAWIALRLGLSATTALVVAALIAAAPVPVRVSASPEAHVFAFALASLALAASLEAVASRRRAWLAVGVTSVALAAFTRVDAWLALGTVPIWAISMPQRGTAAFRLAAGAAYLAAWFGVGIAAYAWVAVPSNHPFPSAVWIETAAASLLAQFPDTARATPSWFPLAAVVLAPAGALWALLRRRGLLLAAAVTFLSVFVPLGRTIVGEGPVVGRYFMFGASVVFLLAAVAVGEVLVPLVRRLFPAPAVATVAPAICAAAVFAAVAAGARGAYVASYAFADEYRFLRGALADLPDDCTVIQLPVRSHRFGGDIDCCLDAARSPLTAEFPRLRFVTVGSVRPIEEELDRAIPPAACVVYYRGAACVLAGAPDVDINFVEAAAWYTDACPAAARRFVADPIATTDVSPNASDRPLVSTRPRVGLFARR